MSNQEGKVSRETRGHIFLIGLGSVENYRELIKLAHN